MSKPATCLYKHPLATIGGGRCQMPAECRGLCGTHYMAAWRAVKAGRITWQDLDAAGLARRSGQGAMQNFIQNRKQKLAVNKK